jgi:hypothetical protein
MRPASLPARTGQQSRVPRNPLFVCPGEHAAELWLQVLMPDFSMGEFRDLQFRNLVAGLGSLDDYTACQTAFNEGFARVIGVSIASAARATNGGAR